MNAAFDLAARFGGGGAVVLAATWCVAVLARRASAATREMIVRAGLLAAAVAPPLAMLLPVRGFAVIPSFANLTGPATTSARSVDSADATRATPTARESAIDAATTLESESAFDFGAWLLGAWALGCASVVVRTIVALARERRSVRRMQALDDANWREDVAATKARLGLRRSVEVRERSNGVPPYVTGWFRRVVVVPHDALTWSRERRRAILAHELAHVERADAIWIVVLRLAVAMRWFDPIAWRLERVASALREHACDDRALEVGVLPSQLAHALWSTVHDAQHASESVAIAGMARRSMLASRVAHCLRIGQSRRRATFFARGLATAATFALGIAIAAESPGPRLAIVTPAARAVQARWTDGILTVGAFLRGNATIDADSHELTHLSRGASVVVFATERGSPTIHTWAATSDAASAIVWRAFNGELELREPIADNALWKRVGAETMHRIAAALDSATPRAARSRHVSGSTLSGVPACSSDPSERVVQRTFEHGDDRVGVFAHDATWSAFVLDRADGTQSIAIRPEGSAAVVPLIGAANGLGDIAAEGARHVLSALAEDI